MILSPTQVGAHAAGASYEEEKDGYLIDIGYNPETPLVGSRVRLDFSLFSLTATSSSKDLFTDVWVRITKNGVLYFSGNLNQPYFGPTAMNLLLTEPGTYEVYTRFQNNADMVTDTTFSLPIMAAAEELPAEPGIPTERYMLFASMLFVLSWVTWLIFSWWRNSRKM